MEPKNEIQKTESPLVAAAALVQADGNMDVAKLKELLEVQERWDATQAKKAYIVAMASFKENPPEIIKDKTVDYKDVKYSHASLHNVTTSINTALSTHGLTASWVTSQDNGSVKVTCKITHIMGHSEETCLSAPPDATGSKNAIQSIGSTVTYLQRYTLLALTGLATHDQDDDGKGADPKEKLPPKPNKQQSEVLDSICEILRKETNKEVLKDKVAAIFLIDEGSYPSNPAKTAAAAKWLIDLNRESEWTDKGDMTKLMKTIDQAYFEFETVHNDYLADFDGKMEFTQDSFIKEITRAFGTLPVSRTVEEIVAAVHPENVAVKVKDE